MRLASEANLLVERRGRVDAVQDSEEAAARLGFDIVEAVDRDSEPDLRLVLKTGAEIEKVCRLALVCVRVSEKDE